MSCTRSLIPLVGWSLAVLLGTVLIPSPLLPGADPTTQFADGGDADESDAKTWAELQLEAAEYQRERFRAPKSQFDDVAAKRYLDRARELLTTGHEIRARWWAEDAFDEFPYSSLAGDALRMGMEGAAVHGSINQVRDKLSRLWLFIPDYPGLGEAMDRAMSVAEDVQDFSKAVNLDAEEPSEVIRLDGRSTQNDTETNRLLRFLSLHGDRESIAPRATLGLARGLLLIGSKDDIYAARRAYEKFLEDYPNNYLTFTAFCEYALSYLVAYRGDQYDIGSLHMANAVIDQAEIETRGDPLRAATVQAYRKRIRVWLQDRDLAVARWYRARGTPRLLTWLKSPPGLLSWEDGARFFYREVIKRDATSPAGRNAERELAEVAQVRPDTLGAATP
jgi:hypothetical protein